MRGAFIGGALNSKSRTKLKYELDLILFGSAKQREIFLNLADEALDEHLKILVPFHRDAEYRKIRLERLIEAGNEFSKSIGAIDTDLNDIIFQEYIVIERRSGTEVDGAMAAAKLAMQRLILASEVGLNISAVGRRILTRGVSKPSVRSYNHLVRQLAHGYDSIFGERPSWSSRGTFARAVEAVFRIGGIKDARGRPAQMGQSRLRSVLQEERFKSDAPTRGRKARKL